MTSLTSPKQLALNLIKDLNLRSQDILKKRFGIVDNQIKTLEAIGKEYHITRERVRQIVNSLLKQLKSLPLNNSLKEFYKLALLTLKEKNGIYPQAELLNLINQKISSENETQAINFLLTINDDFVFEKEEKNCYPFWHLKEIDGEKVKKEIKELEKYLKKAGKSFKLEEILAFAKKKINKNLTKELLEIYLKLSKNIKRNIFGEYGFYSLSEINPSGAREKAYLILKHLNKPMHFREIADKINEATQKEFQTINTSARWFKPVQVQTVHNELIKDPRFVLVGRGIYALRDWGYKPGKVVDIIRAILAKAKKPLSQEEIIKEVKKQRLAKDNTIILNLHNKKYFKRLPNKKYILAKETKSQVKVMEI